MFLNETVDNVLAVHCQGGKGRTGSFCSSIMFWTGLFSSADEALVHVFCVLHSHFARRYSLRAFSQAAEACVDQLG